MKRITVFVGMLALVAALVAAPGPAKAAMWVGIEAGPNWMAGSDIKLSGDGGSVTLNNYKWDAKPMGGVIFGYHFVNSGFLAYNWPDWMKYFQFAIDFSYHTIETRARSFDFGESAAALDIGSFDVSRIKGDVFTVAFLFIGCYGFYPDSVAPFGRVVPYIGVGPALVQSWIQGGVSTGKEVFNFTKTSTDIALVAEAGVRFMALKNVSLDMAFRYRWFQPNYTLAEFDGTKVEAGIRDAHLFNLLVRASYHF